MIITKMGDSKSKMADKITKINKLLARYGFSNAVILSEEEVFEDLTGTEVHDTNITSLKIRGYKWTIEIPVNKFGQDGTEFVAYLEFGSEAAGNRVLPAYDSTHENAADYDALLLELAKSKRNNCDHCNTIRTRNKLFVFKKDGQVYTIGSTCAREWYGIEIEGFLNAWKSISTFSEDDGEWHGSSASRRMEYVSEILTYAMASIDHHGFVAGKSERSSSSDADFCYAWLHVSEVAKAHAKPETLVHLNEGTNRARINDMIARMADWYQTVSPTTLFDHNLRSGVIDLTLTAGMAPWAIKMWMDAEKLAYRTGNVIDQIHNAVEIMDSPNEWVALGGEKVSVDGQVVMTRAFDGNYGVSYLIKVATPKGMVVWFSSNSNFENCNINDLIKGTKISISGKVKKNDEYQGVKQTTLTRCKLSMKED